MRSAALGCGCATCIIHKNDAVPHALNIDGGKATLETTILAIPTPGTLAPVFTCKVRVGLLID